MSTSIFKPILKKGLPVGLPSGPANTIAAATGILYDNLVSKDAVRDANRRADTNRAYADKQFRRAEDEDLRRQRLFQNPVQTEEEIIKQRKRLLGQ